MISSDVHDHGGRVGRRVVALPALALAGLWTGAAGAFAQAITFDFAGVALPVGLVGALAVTATVLLTGARVVRSRTGAVVPALGWLVAVLVLSSGRPEGDLVLPANAGSYAFLLLGTVVVGAVVGFSGPRAGRR